MENTIKQETERWVEDRMALLAAPEDWEPDAGIARARLQGRLSARRPTQARTWIPRVATVALACLVLIFVIPTTRALTQELWQWLTVRKVEVVQGDFERLRGIWLMPQIRIVHREIPDETGKDFVEPEPPPPLSLRQAARRAGFTPRLPHEGVLTEEPKVRTFDPIVWSATLKAADLESSLRQAGVNDQPIPKEWDGAQLSIHIGSAVIANWDEARLTLMQHPPISFSAPAGFDFVKYWTAALRAAGISRDESEQLAKRITATPTLLLGIVSENKVAIREVNLRSGPATLVEHIGKTGKVESVMLIWNEVDRVYHLTARSEEQALLAANSIEAEQNAPVVVAESSTAVEFPIGSYRFRIEKEYFILTFTADGRVLAQKVEGRHVFEGVYTTKGDEIVMKEMKETQGKTEKGCEGEGKYKWSFDGKALILTTIADDCDGREWALTASPLPLVDGKK